MDKATEKEVEMFLIAIAKNPPTMNLDGYADINRGLITSVDNNCGIEKQKLSKYLFFFTFQNISFMATYLVVLLQFKLTLLRQTAKNAMLANMRNQTASMDALVADVLSTTTVKP